MRIVHPDHIKELETLKQRYTSLPWYTRFFFRLGSWQQASAWSNLNPRHTTTEYLEKLIHLQESAWLFNSKFRLLIEALKNTKIYSLSQIHYPGIYGPPGSRKPREVEVIDKKFNSIFTENTYIVKKISPYLTTQEQSNLILSFGFASDSLQEERLFNKFLPHVVKGQRKDAQKLARRYPNFVLKRGTVTDDAGRTFSDITALEYAFWALDNHTYKMLLDCIPQTQEGDEIRAKVRAQYDKFKRYDLGSLSTTARTPHKIYMQSTETGLSYEVIGLDGTLKQGLIPQEKLPKDLPKEVTHIIKAKDKWLPILLNHTAEAGFTDTISLTQQEQGIRYTFKGMSFAFACFETEDLRQLKTLLRERGFNAINWIDENNPALYQKLPIKQKKIQTIKDLLNQINSEEARIFKNNLLTEEASIQENHYDFELIDALLIQRNYYPQPWGYWPEILNHWDEMMNPESEINSHWRRGLGGSQCRTTAKIRQAYCSKLTLKQINNLGDEEAWPEEMDYYNLLTDKAEKFSSETLSEEPSLGNELGIYKFHLSDEFSVAIGASHVVVVPPSNREFSELVRLCQTSTSKFLELEPRLTPESRTQFNPGSGSG